MANKAFDREVYNLREKLISGDFNLAQTYSDLALRESLSQLLSGRNPLAGGDNDETRLSFRGSFIGDAFKVRSSSSMNVSITPGIGFVKFVGDNPADIDGISGLTDSSTLKPLVLLQNQPFPVPANPSGDVRIDIIEVRYNRETDDSQVRQVLNQTTGAFDVTAVDKKLSWGLDGLVGSVISPAASTEPISYKQGIAGSGIPLTTPGYAKIAEIYVDSGAVSIEPENIVDFRSFLFPNGCGVVSAEISLPNVDSGSLTRSTYQPELLSITAPSGMQASCYVTSAGKKYEFVITGNFSFAHAVVSSVGSVGSVFSFNQFVSLPVGARIEEIVVEEVGTSRANDLANSTISSPSLQVAPTQKAAIVRFCPYKAFLDAGVVKYTTKIDGISGAPLVVSLIVVVV